MVQARHVHCVEDLNAVERVQPQRGQRRFDEADPGNDHHRHVFFIGQGANQADRRFTHLWIAWHGIDDALWPRAEPHHFGDWWPRVRGVRPDRRGFAPGARWQVVADEQLSVTSWRNPERHPKTLVIGELEPLERWTWHLTGPAPVDVEVRLATAGPDLTAVTVTVEGGRLARPDRIAREAVDRLHALVQTAAEV